MTNKLSTKLGPYIESASESGLSGKASAVYVTLLDVGEAISPKGIITRTSLHRQYVYDALHELQQRGLIHSDGYGKSVKYMAVSPDKMIKDVEIERLRTLDNVQNLMKLYNKSPSGVVEIVTGSQAVIEHEFKLLKEAKNGDHLDIIGGAGMHFNRLFTGRLEEWESSRREKNIKLRYIGGCDDVKHNKTSIIRNESRKIQGIENIVNISIRPGSVTFNIYEPEILSVHIKNEATVLSQQALFEVLWKIAK